MTTTDTETAVRYDRDADGIVTLTLDDPTASANTMNELYARVDGGRRRAAPTSRGRRRHRRRRRQRQEDLLRRRQPQAMVQAAPSDAEAIFAMAEAIKASPAPPRDVPPPGGRGDQRCRARRRPRDRPGRQPPHRRRRPLGQDRPARGDARPAARRRRGHPRRPDARPAVRADGRAAARHPVQAGGGARQGPRRRAGGHPRGAGPRGEGVDPRAPRRRGRRRQPLGPRRLQDARRHAEDPGAGGVPAGVPGAAAQADQGRGLPRPAGDHERGRRGRAGRLRHRLAHRVALPHQRWSSASTPRT